MKNYCFDFDFGQPWGNCSVVMTCVSGHLTEAKFPAMYERDWSNPPPEALFNAPVNVEVGEVGFVHILHFGNDHLTKSRIKNLSRTISQVKREGPELSLSGLIAIERANISVARFAKKL